MSIKVVFLMAIIKKESIRSHYRGGLARFRQDYPFAAEDKHLLAISAMSSGEFDEFVADLLDKGLTMPDCFAIGEQNRGQVSASPGIWFWEFVTGGVFPEYEAELLFNDSEDSTDLDPDRPE